MALNNLFIQGDASEIHQVLQAIFQNAIDGIIAINGEGIIEAINPAAVILFGYEAGEVIGKNISMLMPEPYRSGHDDYIENYHRTGMAKIIGIGREVRGLRKDGSIFPFRLSVSEVKSSNRRLYAGFIHDVSDLRKTKNELEELNINLEKLVAQRTEELSVSIDHALATNRQLEYEIKERKAAEEALRKNEKEILASYKKEKELGALKSRFVSMASHEFRTPLTTISSSASILARYTLTEQQEKREKHVNRIQNSVQHLTNILNDFLSLGKLEEGKLKIKLQEISWNAFSKEILEELRASLKIGQVIDFQNQSSNFVIYSDEQLLKQILFNLISNATKYSPANSIIAIKSTVDQDRLVISVQDEGMGIPQSEQKYLFTRFFRAENVSNIQGTGLGLTIVKRYLELLNGVIYFESEEGKGSTFTIEIPIAHHASQSE